MNEVDHDMKNYQVEWQYKAIISITLFNMRLFRFCRQVIMKL